MRTIKVRSSSCMPSIPIMDWVDWDMIAKRLHCSCCLLVICDAPSIFMGQSTLRNLQSGSFLQSAWPTCLHQYGLHYLHTIPYAPALSLIWSTQQRVNDVDSSGSSKSHQPSKSLTSRCVRSSRGQDANQVCEPCLANHVQCVTKKRRVGRQPGAKNRQREGEASSGYSEVIATSDIDHLPNPLHVLASVAAGGHPALP